MASKLDSPHSFLDFLGQEVFLGDIVITTRLSYREFIRAEVMKITPKMVFLRAKAAWTQRQDVFDEWKAEHQFTIKMPNKE